MFNRQTLIGNLGDDPVIRETGSQPVTNFRMATSWQGSGDKVTTWHNIVVFGNSAKAVAEYLRKGSLVFVEGRTQHRTFEGNDGVTKYITEVVANEVKFLDKAPKGEPAEEQATPAKGKTAKKDIFGF